MLEDASQIEAELKEFAAAYEKLDHVFDEISSLGVVIDDLETTVEFLEEAMGRIEIKLKHTA
jgi:chaperonin cofactor prefoldin